MCSAQRKINHNTYKIWGCVKILYYYTVFDQYWDKIKADVIDLTKTSPTYQRFENIEKKYGKLPPKEVIMAPWETAYIDLIGPYTVTDRVGNDRTLNAMTFIDPSIGWFGIIGVPDNTRTRISQFFPNTRISKYSYCRTVIFYNGIKLKNYFLHLLRDSSIKPTPILTVIKNPQDNVTVQCVHQTVNEKKFMLIMWWVLFVKCKTFSLQRCNIL